MNRTAPITKTMTMQEIMRLHPAAVGVLASFRLHCAGCGGARHETVEKGAIAHGLDVDELLAALNAAIGS